MIPNEFGLSMNPARMLTTRNVYLGYRIGRFCHAVNAYDLNDQGEVMVQEPQSRWPP